jgi:hypothetical protein
MDLPAPQDEDNRFLQSIANFCTDCTGSHPRAVRESRTQKLLLNSAKLNSKQLFVLLFARFFYSDPEDGHSTFLRNVAKLLPNYTALLSRSYSKPSLIRIEK